MEALTGGLFKVLGALLGVFLVAAVGVAILYFIVYTCIFILVS